VVQLGAGDGVLRELGGGGESAVFVQEMVDLLVHCALLCDERMQGRSARGGAPWLRPYVACEPGDYLRKSGACQAGSARSQAADRAGYLRIRVSGSAAPAADS